MSKLSEFFFNSQSSVVMLELIEISHPSFSKTYRIVRNKVDGVTVTTEKKIYSTVEIDGVTVTNENPEIVTFDYYPIEIEKNSARTDLDYSIKCNLGDVGEIISAELDRVFADGSSGTYPVVIYREYRSDDLSAPLMVRDKLIIESIPLDGYGSSFEAKSENYNQNGTGEIMSFDRFPMLRDTV